METGLCVLIAAFLATSIYLMLSRHIIPILLGVAILGNAVNLIIFTAGRLTREVPPVIAPDQMMAAMPIANPLPQALILTAIVISFSFFAFLLVLAYRTFQEVGTDNVDEMRIAESADGASPPMEY